MTVKRIAELRALSRDHHHALVLARKARRAVSGGAGQEVAEGWREVRERFERELDDHFKIEEEYLAPALAVRGETTLVARLCAEHAALRGTVAGEGSAAALLRFAGILEQHIRFEERKLFEVAQVVLDRQTLKAVEGACRARKRQR